MKPVSLKSLLVPGLGLFTSLGTLVCCALPALLVALGAGAVLAGLVSAVPQLVLLSEYKEIVFTVAGLLIVVAGLLQWRNRNAPCPIDPAQAVLCTRLRKVGVWIYGVSVIVYLTGFFFAFLAVKVL